MTAPEGLKSMLRYRGFGPLEPIWEGRNLCDKDRWFSNEKDIALAKGVATLGIDALYYCERAMTRYEASRRHRVQSETLLAMRSIAGFDPKTDEDYLVFKEKVWANDGTFGRPCEGSNRDRLLVALLRRNYEKTPGVSHIASLRLYALRFGFDAVIFVTENGVTNPAKEICGFGPAVEDAKASDEKGSSKKKKKSKEDEEDEASEEEEEPEVEEEEPEEVVAEIEEDREEEEVEAVAPEIKEVIENKVAARVELVEYKDLEYDATENFFFPLFRLLNEEERIERLHMSLVDFHLRGSDSRVEPSVEVSSRIVPPAYRDELERRRRLLARAWKELPRLLPADPVCKLFALEEGDVIEVLENTMIGFEAQRKLMIVCRTNNVEPRKT